ncbi:hypothetical protein [Chelatococcus asaccharovorans]|uniref:hypothetical protein n=1 Tax=Chelatococcus asaccharovorans TaxID=28210 RepID=UPI00224C700D|nr:hypothetical protein [Chelatococcus asaccharovorans]CAH1665761.1 conserved hypothetical protein [Chelatococcus asaccharovorans]CAH1681796.1 conserved hypothetical protein [Chelatococcus asaccharovorans]
MDNAAAITTIAQALEDKPDVLALYLGGSFGVGLEDAHSDLDFVAVTTEGPTDAFASLWHDAVSRTGEIVLWWDRQAKPMLINAITAEWLRVDVQIATPAQTAALSRNSLKVLFDHQGIYERLPHSSGPRGSEPKRLKWQFEEFIRILGLLPLALGRAEYINSVTGAFHLRNLLIDLLIEETDAPNRGGALHLNRLITAEQKDLLAALPALTPRREAIIPAYLAYAAAYLPRARALAVARGIAWPARFEQATWARLKKELAIEPQSLNA